jgi:hypothetical protein
MLTTQEQISKDREDKVTGRTFVWGVNMRSEAMTRLWQDCEIILSKINELSESGSKDVDIESLEKALPLFKVIKEMCFFLKEYSLVDCKNGDDISKKTKVSLTTRGRLYLQYHDSSLLKYKE